MFYISFERRYIYINMVCKNCIKFVNLYIFYVGEENRIKILILNEFGDW